MERDFKMRRIVLMPLILLATYFAGQSESRHDDIENSDNGNSKFNWIGSKFKYINGMGWTKGPNVCASEEVIGDSKRRYYSECMPFAPRKICQKPTFIRYHCCTGFEKENEEKSEGCQAVKPVVDLEKTITDLYLTEFRNHLNTSDHQMGLLTSNAAFTIFAPQNKAFKKLPNHIKQLLLIRSPPEDNLMMYHVTANRYHTSDLRNNAQVPTLYKNNETLHIHRYGNGILTANCVRIVLPNQPATNGLVHVTEQVIKPVDERGTVMDILLNYDQMGEFVTALILTQVATELRGHGHLTVFAPTDAAFRNMPQKTAERIMADSELIKKLLLYHIVDCCVCSAAILGPTSMRTLEGQKVNLTCDVKDRLIVNGVVCSEVDAVGTNGVVHSIDQVLIPDSVKTLGEMSSELGLHEFLSFARQAGLTDILDAKESEEFTIFAPSDEAFSKLSQQQRTLLRSHKKEMKRMLEYHMVRGRTSTNSMIGTETLETKTKETSSGGNLSVKLVVSVYGREYGVNNARILKSNYEVANGVVHVIDQVLFPASATIASKIKDNMELSTFQSLLRLSGFEKTLSNREGKWTMFAPNNAAFKELEESEMERLRSNATELRLFVQYHLLEKPIYPCGIRPELLYRHQTLSKDWITLKQESSSKNPTIKVNKVSEITKTDVDNVNGVLYITNKVLRCPCIHG